MALFEKVTKALDSLKLTVRIENVTKKKDVSIQFNCLADSICSPSLNEHTQIADLVGPAVETFLRFCDDPDSDIRMLADECLTRVIKATMLNYSGKVQAELCKHIKRNGPTKSLRIALTRFADLCHLIRPQKCRAYWLSMLSCMIAMSQRTEEILWETLSVFIQKTLPVLGLFAFDNEIKSLLRAWLPNLSSTSATIRRCSATCMAVAANCGRKPQLSIALLIEHLTEQLAYGETTLPVPLILGSLLCLRHVLPSITIISDDNHGVPLGRLLQMYELCIHFSSHDDHNVVTASLELLLSLLKLPLPFWQESLLNPHGLGDKRIGSELSDSKPQSSSKLTSQWTFDSTHSEDNMLLLEPDVIVAPIVSIGNKSEENGEEIHHDLSALEDFVLKREDEPDMPSRQSTLEETFVFEAEKDEVVVETERRLVTGIGSLYDPHMPLLYTARHLVAYFLLEHDGTVVSDRSVRVAVKSLALQSLLSVTQLHPNIWKLNLRCDGETGPLISQIVDYAGHSDPQLRGHVILCASHMLTQPGFLGRKEKLESLILKGFEDGAAFVARSAVQGFACCLSTCWSQMLLENFHSVARNPYWLVKVEYLDVMQNFPWLEIRFSEHSKFYHNSLRNVEKLLGDEDPRVRQAACECLAKLALAGLQAPVLGKTRSLMNEKENETLHTELRNLAKPFTRSYTLSTAVTTDLFEVLRSSSSKHLLVGCTQALAHLAPLGFKLGSTGDLKLLLNLLTSSPLTHDLPAHQYLLKTVAFFLANFANSTEIGPKLTPDLRSLVERLVQHTIHILYIVHWVIENYPPVTSLPNLASRVLLPLSPNRRKLSKAASEKEEDKKFKVVLHPHYLKLFEVAKRTYASSKLVVETSQDKFAAWVESILELLAALLELVGLEDVGKLAEDFLVCLKSCVISQPVLSISCTQQLLKSLFGANLVACRGSTYAAQSEPLSRQEDIYSMLYEENTVSADLPKSRLSRSSSLANDRTVMSSYIRMFETMVIKSLKLYTMNSSTCLQRQVLELINQLIQLHLNYCLLDADLTFFRFVLQQFEFLDEGFIPKAETLLPSVFTFLVLLSYEKYHSKPIINVPRIIQLCGSLLATGKDPIQYVIPALGPIVKDVFSRTGYFEDKAECETQREVLISTMLRLIIHPQVFPWLGVALHEYQAEGESWVRLSQQMASLLIPALVRGQVLLKGAEDTRVLLELMEALAQTWNVESLVQGVLAPPSTLVVNKVTLEVWRTWLLNRSVLVCFLAPKLTAEVGKKVCSIPHFSLWSEESSIIPSDPLNASESPVMVQNALLSVLLELIVLSAECLVLSQDPNDALSHVVTQLMSALTSSGLKGFLSNAAEAEQSKVAKISQLALDGVHFQPLVAIYWSRVLSGMECDCWEFFNKLRLLGDSLNAYIVQRGVFAVLCSAKEPEESFLSHAAFALEFIEEHPVQYCVDLLHKQPETSYRLLKTLSQSHFNKRDDLLKLWKATRNCYRRPDCLSKLLTIAVEQIFPRHPELGAKAHAELCSTISELSEPFLPPETLRKLLSMLENYSPSYDELAQRLHNLHIPRKDFHSAPLDENVFRDWLACSIAYPTESTIGCAIWSRVKRDHQNPRWLGLALACRDGPVDVLVHHWHSCLHEPTSIEQLNIDEMVGLSSSLDIALERSTVKHSVEQLMGDDLPRAAALCLQLAGSVVASNVKYACQFLSCAARAFKQTKLLDEQNCGQALQGLSRILTFFSPAVKEPSGAVEETDAPHFFHEWGRLWCWAWREDGAHGDCPNEMVRHVQSIVVTLGKLSPRLNSYLRMPPSVISPEMLTELTTNADAVIPSVHVNQLLNKSALQEFVSRTTKLGWINRQQFEETWMTLLGVLFATTEGSNEKIEEDVQLSCWVVKALTDLLLRASRHEDATCSSPFFETRWGGKAQEVLQVLPWEREIYCSRNLIKRQQWLDRTGLDLESCIHLLIDLYTQWVVPQPAIAYPLLLEAMKSMVALSDLFTTSAYYTWLHDTLIALPYTIPPEDPALSIPILIGGLCKSAAFSDAEAITLERLQEMCQMFSYPSVHVAFIRHVGYLGKPGWEQLKLLLNTTTSSTELQRSLLSEMTLILPEVCNSEIVSLLLELLPHVGNKALVVRQVEDWVLEGMVEPHARAQLQKIAGRLLRSCSERDVQPLLRLTLILTYMEMDGAENTDVETIFRTLEWLGALLDRCRDTDKATLGILEKLLPHLFRHYLPAVDVMNRILGLFVNATDDYAARIAALLPLLFDAACEQGQKTMVIEWIFQSLENFLQRLPVELAVWNLGIFFLSASSPESVLRPFFPWWRERRGKFDDADQQIFIWAALEFSHQLDPMSRESFLKLFRSRSHPFYELIGTLPL